MSQDLTQLVTSSAQRARAASLQLAVIPAATRNADSEFYSTHPMTADRLATRLAQKSDARVQNKALRKRLDEKYPRR